MFTRLVVTAAVAVTALTAMAGAPAPGAAGPHASLAAFSAPLDHKGPPPGPPHGDPGGPPGHGHGGPPPGPPPGHDHGHGDWHPGPWHPGNWHPGPSHHWWHGVVSPDRCRDHGGHVDWHRHLCIGGRYDGYWID
jgi:hypothetical protein